MLSSIPIFIPLPDNGMNLSAGEIALGVVLAIVLFIGALLLIDWLEVRSRRKSRERREEHRRQRMESLRMSEKQTDTPVTKENLSGGYGED